jgi:sulfite exporter TauE/SafE
VVAAALSAAAAAHVGTGMLLMTAYGLGTVPALVGLAVASHRAGPVVRRRFYRVGGVLILLVGLQLGLRGAAALGWVPHVHLGDVVLW